MPKYHEAVDRASESDRRYFKCHPDRVVRTRRPIPGEFGQFADDSQIAFVVVSKIREDLRTREIIPWADAVSLS